MLIWNSSFVSPRFGSEVKLKLFDQAKLKKLLWVADVGFAFGEHDSSKTALKRNNELFLWKYGHGVVLAADNKTKCNYENRWEL